MGNLAPTTLPFASDDPAIRQLAERRNIWSTKYPIRACYQNWVQMLKPWVIEGKTLEVGGGAGLMKEVWQGPLVTTDLIATPWSDMQLDAQNMQFKDSSFANVLCMDALHHFPDPHLFFDNAARVLIDGGRILMIEPWITPVSRFYYWLLHHERVCFDEYHESGSAEKDPWDGNMAIPTMIFQREIKDWSARHPELRLIKLQRFSFFDFQFAGGFKKWALVHSPTIYNFLLSCDRKLYFLMPWIAFRAMIIIERIPRNA